MYIDAKGDLYPELIPGAACSGGLCQGGDLAVMIADAKH